LCLAIVELGGETNAGESQGVEEVAFGSSLGADAVCPEGGRLGFWRGSEGYLSLLILVSEDTFSLLGGVAAGDRAVLLEGFFPVAGVDAVFEGEREEDGALSPGGVDFEFEVPFWIDPCDVGSFPVVAKFAALGIESHDGVGFLVGIQLAGDDDFLLIVRRSGSEVFDIDLGGHFGVRRRFFFEDGVLPKGGRRGFA